MNKRFRTWQEVKRDLLKDPEVRREYERLKPEYEIIKAMIEARKKKTTTQAKLAKKLGTTQSAIARVESGNGNPTLKFMHRLADALDMKLEIRFTPR